MVFQQMTGINAVSHLDFEARANPGEGRTH